MTDPVLNHPSFLKKYRAMTAPAMKYTITCQRHRVDSYRHILGNEWPALINSLEDDITEMIQIMEEVHGVHYS